MAKWMMAAKKADFDKIAKEFGVSPVLARIMRNRDLQTEEEIRKFLNGTIADLYEPSLMKGMVQGCSLLAKKIKEQALIRIIGDYDVDGICATYILLRGLRELGAKVDTVIPHRMKDGYGLNDHLIEQAKADGMDTIVTCDNGIAAASQIELAKSYGMTVIVTDHHEVPYEEVDGKKEYHIPPADVVIDPKQEDCGYPYKQICGAVVAYKLIQELFSMETEQEQTEKKQILQELLAFAALATICDVMELKDENRILVKEGLHVMEHTTNLGLKALLMVNGLEQKTLSPYHAGFVIGPCLNATGRLDTAGRALELFDASDWKEAVNFATDLKALNESRKQMTEDGVKAAIEQVEASLLEDDVLVVYLPDCHESLAGIIAGKIRERYHKPTFVLTKGEEGIKGSGRSIEAYSMYDEMNRCKELFSKFGGHKLAAGLTLANDNVEEFRRVLNENSTLEEADFQEIVHIDVPMPLALISREFIKEMELLEPFGVGNPKPLFARKNISLISGNRLGKSGKYRKFQIADEQGKTYTTVYFGDCEEMDRYLAERYGEEKIVRLYQGKLAVGEVIISMVYYPELNVFQGRESVQMMMQYYC